MHAFGHYPTLMTTVEDDRPDDFATLPEMVGGEDEQIELLIS